MDLWSILCHLFPWLFKISTVCILISVCWLWHRYSSKKELWGGRNMENGLSVLIKTFLIWGVEIVISSGSCWVFKIRVSWYKFPVYLLFFFFLDSKNFFSSKSLLWIRLSWILVFFFVHCVWIWYCWHWVWLYGSKYHCLRQEPDFWTRLAHIRSY